MRLAWFSPMPPVRSGVAACSGELVEALRGEHEIDVYVDEPVAKAIGATGSRQRAVSAHEFVSRQRLTPYDLTVFQLGNSSHHDYIWPYLFRYPGLTVLHDAHLHHARGAALLRTKRPDDYREEFAANHPDVSRDLAELAVAGFDTHLYYSWPMTRLVAQASRMTVVHTPALAAALRAEVPDAAIDSVRLGHGVAVSAARGAEARARVRADLAIDPHAVVFGVFGGLTPEKRVPQILDAFAALLPYCPAARLVLAGAPASHYDVAADVRRRDLSERVIITGYVEQDEALTDLIAAVDVALNLRWPTAREVSGPWLRALGAGVPTVTLDLWHMGHVPSLDPRTWQSNGGTAGPAVTVAIDIVDEDHSLRLAMRRLAADPALRQSLAAAGRLYWEIEHSPERMAADYRRVITRAASSFRPAGQSPELPEHLVTGGGRVLRGVLDRFGLPPLLLE